MPQQEVLHDLRVIGMKHQDYSIIVRSLGVSPWAVSNHDRAEGAVHCQATF